MRIVPGDPREYGNFIFNKGPEIRKDISKYFPFLNRTMMQTNWIVDHWASRTFNNTIPFMPTQPEGFEFLVINEMTDEFYE